MAHFGKKEVEMAKKKTEEQVAAGLKRLREEQDIDVTDDEVIINISKKIKLEGAADELRDLGIGLKDYDFQDRLPKAGQGLILLNKTDKDSEVFGCAYNMHLGGVVAYQPGKAATISDMSEIESDDPVLETMKTMEILSVEAFRGGDEYPARFFAMGLLEADMNT